MSNIAGSPATTLTPLQPRGAGGVEHVENWEELARSQGRITAARLQNALSGESFAMEDRNLVSLPWRRVYLVRDGDAFVIYDSDGWLLDEPGSGCKDGREPVGELLDFFEETEGLYYRPPTSIRRSLIRHRDTPKPANKKQQRSLAIDSADAQEGVEQPAEAVEAAGQQHPGAGDEKAVHPRGGSQESSKQQQPKAAEDAAMPEHTPVAEPGENTDGEVGALELLDYLATSSEVVEVLQHEKHNELVQEMREVEQPRTPGSHDAAGDDDVEDVHSSIADDTSSSASEVEKSPQPPLSPTSPRSPKPPQNSLSQLKDPDVDDGIEYYVGQRVMVMGVEPEYSGMVAATSESGDIVVASNNGEWHHLTVREVRSRVHAEQAEHLVDDASIAVRALSRDSNGMAITGMLMGVADEHLFGGQMNSYHAHFAWREDNFTSHSVDKMTTRSSATTESSTAKTFAIGDIVTQTNTNGGSRATAVVVRIAYKPRIGSAQARRLLLLHEMLGNHDDAPNEAPQLFPASWCNWDRVKVDPKGAECKYADASVTNHHCLEEVDELDELEKVCALSTARLSE